MSYVKSYDSMEAMQADMARMEEEANRRTRPWQQAIAKGQNFIGYEDSEDLWFFCHVLTDAELGWEKPAQSDEERRERQAEKVMSADTFRRGYRFCRTWSAWTGDEGELEDCHVLKALRVLTDEELELMRGINWGVRDAMNAPDLDRGSPTGRLLVEVVGLALRRMMGQL